MKNIHLLATNKPSRLIKTNDDNLVLLPDNDYREEDVKIWNFTPQNVYITSGETIKINDFVYNVTLKIVVRAKRQGFSGEDDWYKIALTTDENLIKDGVQPIDDEFLRKYIKNPSTEFEIDKGYRGLDKITTPKAHSFCKTPETNCTMNYCDENGCQNRKRFNTEDFEQKTNKIIQEEIQLKDPNTCSYYKELGCVKDCCDCYALVSKESLEEAAEKWFSQDSFYPDPKKGFIDGARWQSERMYSEEEVFNIINLFSRFLLDNRELQGLSREVEISRWFEQFKKKKDEDNNN